MAETFISESDINTRIILHPDFNKQDRRKFRYRTKLVYSTSAKHIENLKRQPRQHIVKKLETV